MKTSNWSFYDAADREAVRKKNPNAVKSWIDDSMKGTSVTVVLIGVETSTREWVQYEIYKSVELGKGLLGVYINEIENQYGYADRRGLNPLPYGYRVYDWIPNNGYANLGIWIEQAALDARR